MAVASPFLGGFVLELPFVPKRVGRLGEPFGIISQRLNLDAGKVFDRARRRMSQWLQQTEADQDSDVIRLKTETPGGFSGCKPPWQHRQAQNQIGRASCRERV